MFFISANCESKGSPVLASGSKAFWILFLDAFELGFGEAAGISSTRRGPIFTGLGDRAIFVAHRLATMRNSFQQNKSEIERSF